MPDDFLAVLKAHRRAPLKIYLGMAAGVGKTVAMLKDGKRLIAEGVDVALVQSEKSWRTSDTLVADCAVAALVRPKTKPPTQSNEASRLITRDAEAIETSP